MVNQPTVGHPVHDSTSDAAAVILPASEYAVRDKWSWLSREVIGWSMFDFANQAFTMVIITVMYQVYFINYVVPASEGGGNELGKRLWETSTIIGEIFIIAISPLAGALADFSGAKKKALFVTYLGCVLFTLALGLVTPGQVALGMVFFIIGYIFFASGENFLNAFLPEIADHRHMGRVSGFSWTIAYFGSLISMAVAVLITTKFPLNAAILLNEGESKLSSPSRMTLDLDDPSHNDGEPAQKAATALGAAHDFQHVEHFREILPEDVEPELVATADFDGDETNDLSYVEPGSAQVQVRFGAQLDSSELPIEVAEPPRALGAARIGPDGQWAVVVLVNADRLQGFALDSSRQWRLFVDAATGGGAKYLRFSDVNVDGRSDIVIGRTGTAPAGYRLVGVWCGIYFLLAGVPTFLLLRERKLAEKLPPGQSIYTVGFARLAQTFRDVRRYRQLMRFLMICAIYIAGMQVVVFYAGSITKELFDFDERKQGLFMLQVIVTGIVGAAITGRVQDRIGTRTTIQMLLAIWSLTMLVASLAEREWVFWVTGNLVGFSMGALGTSSRVMAGLFSPQHKAAEFFGFYGMAHKFAVILGMGFQFMLGMAGASYRAAIGASSIFFVAGLLLMFSINEKEGRIVALKSAREHVRKHRDYAGEIPGDPT